MLNQWLAVAAGTVLALTLVSGAIKTRFWTSEAIICLAVGVAIGPLGFALFSMDPMGRDEDLHFFEQAARLTLALSVMSAALSLPRGYMRSNWRLLLLVLGPGMILMWATASGFAWAMLGMSVPLALLCGAIVTPTDPVLARSIVTGRLAEESVPRSTRLAITAESGINDGLALPLVMAPLLFLSSPSQALGSSAAYLAWEVAGAVILGGLLGHATGFAYRRGREHDFTEEKSLTATTLALALLALASVALLRADGVLAVFIAGLVFHRAMKDEGEDSHEHFQDAVDRSLTLPIFILLGVAAPWGEWLAGGWPLWAAALGIVLLRRLPAWLLLQKTASPYPNRREAAFAGSFGPVGVAALFYAAVALGHGGGAQLWALITLSVCLSVLIHGITGTPLTRRHGKKSALAPDQREQC